MKKHGIGRIRDVKSGYLGPVVRKVQRDKNALYEARIARWIAIHWITLHRKFVAMQNDEYVYRFFLKTKIVFHHLFCRRVLKKRRGHARSRLWLKI